MFRLHLDAATNPLDLRLGARLRWFSLVSGSPKLERRRPRRSAVGFEALETSAVPALLLVRPPEVRARINGLPAPRLALLRAGDLFSLEAGPLLTVELEPLPTRAALGPARCPLCRDTVQPGQQRLTCPCGCALHAADDLNCAAMVSACPACGAALEHSPEEVGVEGEVPQ
jgi:hypothetical protein